MTRRLLLVLCAATLLTTGLLGSCGGEDEAAEPARILPQQSPYNIGYVPVATAEHADVQRTFSVQLSNPGDRVLTIESARILGDLRCSFAQPSVVVPSAQPNGTSAVVVFGYRPQSPGDDDALLEIASNASNFPTLQIPLCGGAYDPAETAEAPAPRACGEPTETLNETCDLTPEGEGQEAEADAGVDDAGTE